MLFQSLGNLEEVGAFHKWLTKASELEFLAHSKGQHTFRQADPTLNPV
jgi:hypothetical protein